MIFDSNEEKWFSWYLDELYDAGYIEKYVAQPENYVLSTPIFYDYIKQLKTKTKIIVKKLIREHIYSPDFGIIWNEKARGIFFNNIQDNVDLKTIPFIACHLIYKENMGSVIEIKPAFSLHKGQREFSINQKFMCQKHNIYVQKVIIDNSNKGLFAKTFTPKKYLLTDKTGKKRKLRYQPFSLEAFIKK